MLVTEYFKLLTPSECRKLHFRTLKFQNFLGEAPSRTVPGMKPCSLARCGAHVSPPEIIISPPVRELNEGSQCDVFTIQRDSRLKLTQMMLQIGHKKVTNLISAWEYTSWNTFLDLDLNSTCTWTVLAISVFCGTWTWIVLAISFAAVLVLVLVLAIKIFAVLVLVLAIKFVAILGLVLVLAIKFVAILVLVLVLAIKFPRDWILVLVLAIAYLYPTLIETLICSIIWHHFLFWYLSNNWQLCQIDF